MPEAKQMSVYALIAALISGGGGYGSYEVFNFLVEQGDDRWVTIASQNQELMFDIEDELGEIQRRIDKGEETVDDLIRKAVLEERLRGLMK